MDGTGSLVILAWALTPGETTENWAWFFAHLKTALANLNTTNCCIVNDRNLGLIGALEQHLPLADKTWCCFHIAKNIKDNGHSEAATRHFWKMVYCKTQEQFKGHMSRLEELDKGGASYIAGIEPSKWATWAVKGRRYGHVTSNLAEIANAMLVQARYMHPLACLDHIYSSQMERFFSRHQQAVQCTSPIVPTEYARLQAAIIEAQRMVVICSNEFSGRVTNVDGRQYVVNLPKTREDAGMCDCSRYQDLLRPCKHAVALIKQLKKSVAPFYHGYYTTEGWKKMYEHSYTPINISTLKINSVQGPAFKRKRGRPQTERKEKGEGPSKRSCSICGLEGHRHKD
ncbi:hypothetical protein CF319_g9516 [Tilletia indica]|nr:hypothetical protein CF319_g9516 [Tilletia indica]